MADHVPKGIRPIENGARQVIEATIAGLGVGAMVGSIDAYLKSPVVIGGRRAPVLREVAGQLGRTSLLWGATWFTFVFTKQIVSGLRGSSVDATSSLLGGAAAGTVFGMSKRSGRAVVLNAAVFGIAAWLIEGHVPYFNELQRRDEIRKDNEVEITQRYQKKVQEDHKRVQEAIIESETNAMKQIQQ